MIVRSSVVVVIASWLMVGCSGAPEGPATSEPTSETAQAQTALGGGGLGEGQWRCTETGRVYASETTCVDHCKERCMPGVLAAEQPATADVASSVGEGQWLCRETGRVFESDKACLAHCESSGRGVLAACIPGVL
jgi:hypothetical protein